MASVSHAPQASTHVAAEHWDRRFEAAASEAERAQHYALASRFYCTRYLEPLFQPHGKDWLAWVINRLPERKPLERVLVLGCGIGDGLVDLARRGIARTVVGVDLSATAVECARDFAREAGLESRIEVVQGDFDTVDLGSERFPAVFMIMSLHHSMEVERTLRRVRALMAEGGVFVANEYVGPSRWQFTWPQLAAIKLLLTVLPKRLRRLPDGTTKGRIGRPSIEWMLRTDPSEAAQSDLILPLLARDFTIEAQVEYGGAISLPVLDGIIANFENAGRAGERWCDRIMRTEALLTRIGLLRNANGVYLCRAK